MPRRRHLQATEAIDVLLQNQAPSGAWGFMVTPRGRNVTPTWRRCGPELGLLQLCEPDLGLDLARTRIFEPMS